MRERRHRWSLHSLNACSTYSLTTSYYYYCSYVIILSYILLYVNSLFIFNYIIVSLTISCTILCPILYVLTIKFNLAATATQLYIKIYPSQVVTLRNFTHISVIVYLHR